MQIDKKLELILKKKVALEKLRVEEETIKNWKEKFEQVVIKTNDLRSLEINIKKILQIMETRLKTIQIEIKDLT